MKKDTTTTTPSDNDTNVKAPFAMGLGQEALTNQPCEAAPQTGVHLYHFPISNCSQKVRMALRHKGVDVQYHAVMLNVNDQHLPQYVRINPRCVVPSLVHEGKVTTDSKNILEHLDDLFPASSKRLIPTNPEEQQLCQKWTQLADEIPIHAVCFGTIPGVSKPFLAKMVFQENHDDQMVPLLEGYIQKYQDDAFLKQAYEQKLKVIQSYVKVIQTPASMQKAVDFIESTLEHLNDQLSKRSGGFLCGQELCAADIEWCVLLNRFVVIGAGPKWVYNKDKLPHIGPYFDELTSLSSYQEGIAAFDSKTKLVSLIASRKWNALMGKEIVL